MKTPSNLRPTCELVLLGLSLFGSSLRVEAQDAIMPFPQDELRTVSDRDRLLGEEGPPLYRSPNPETTFQAGQIALRPRLLYRYINAEGLPVAGRRIASEIQTLAPGLQVDLGANWSLDYSPRWVWYTARALRDTVDQSASLKGNVYVADWRVTLGEDFGIASPTLAETAQQTKERTWRTAIDATRDLGSSVTLALGATLAENYTDLFPDTRNWSTEDWILIHSTPTLDWGLGAGAGYVEITAGPDMTYERYLARLDWKPAKKLSMNASGGIEYRHSLATIGRTLRYPTINGGIRYQPFSTTSARLSYVQRLESSYFRNQVNKAGAWTCSLEQRLLGRLYLSADWVRQRSTYAAVTSENSPGVTINSPNNPTAPALVSRPGRSDRVNSFATRLTLQVLKRITLAVTYQDSDNRSSQSDFNFSSKQYGVEFSCRY